MITEYWDDDEDVLVTLAERTACGSHRGPAGPNENHGRCPQCRFPIGVFRPDWETYGDHLPDCSLPRRHPGYCQPGGEGHPRALIIRGGRTSPNIDLG